MSKAAELAKMGEVLTNSQIGGRRNLIINGGMQVAQRATSATGLGGDGFTYNTVDRFKNVMAGSTAGRYTQTQESISDLPGFGKCLKFACTTADTSIAAGELLSFGQYFEGQDVQQLKKGTSDAEKVTASFYVKGNASATYTCELEDADNTRYNAQTFDVTTSWNRVVLTFDADTTGTLDNDNANSLRLNIFLHAGSTYTGGTFSSNTWQTTNNQRANSSQTSFYDSTDRTFFITGIQLEVGEVATPFEHRSFGEELRLCQRYFNIFGTDTSNAYENFGMAVAFSTGTGDIRLGPIPMPVTMRAIPSMAHSGSFACLGQLNFGTLSSIGLADGGSPTNIMLNITGSLSQTSGNVSPFRSNNDTDAFLSFDAEL